MTLINGKYTPPDQPRNVRSFGPSITPQEVVSVPAISAPGQGDGKIDTQKILLSLSFLNNDPNRGVPIETLYIIAAKLFVRLSGSGEEWTEAKTASRQYSSYFSNLLEVKYSKFIVAKDGEVTLTIKINNMEEYDLIKFESIVDLNHTFSVFLYIKLGTEEENKVLKIVSNKSILNAVGKMFSMKKNSTDSYIIAEDYTYANNTLGLTLKDLKKNIQLKLILRNRKNKKNAEYGLPVIWVTE